MKFIHVADLHLGASPAAGRAYSAGRPAELWESLTRLIAVCNEESVDLLLMAGDIFHYQPLLRDLKELDYQFSKLVHTRVVLIAGNHDHLKKTSFYRTFTWQPQVRMILDAQPATVEFPEIATEVCGCSYHERHIRTPLPAALAPLGRQKYRILLLHGGEPEYQPLQPAALAAAGFDYVALGHIHKPEILVADRVAYAGALEPIDTGDIGDHGYIAGQITEQGTSLRFVPFAKRKYINASLVVHREWTAAELRDRIAGRIRAEGSENLYRIILTGFRNPWSRPDPDSLDAVGNIIALVDRTREYYDFPKLLAANRENLLGKFIARYIGAPEDSLEYEILCQGVAALLAARREEV